MYVLNFNSTTSFLPSSPKRLCYSETSPFFKTIPKEQHSSELKSNVALRQRTPLLYNNERHCTTTKMAIDDDRYACLKIQF
jgi:hypothetical protein